MNKNRLIIISGNIGTFLIVIGAMFKIQHYPYQDEMLAFGCMIYFIFWFWILINLFKQDYNLTYKIIWTTLIFVIPFIAWIYYHRVTKHIKTTGNTKYKQ